MLRSEYQTRQLFEIVTNTNLKQVKVFPRSNKQLKQ